MDQSIDLAYIDPVSGVILIQIIIAGLVGIVAFCRRAVWSVFSALIGRQKTNGTKKSSEQ